MRRLICPLLIFVALNLLVAAAAEEGQPSPPRGGVLSFTNGDRLPGALAESTQPGEIAWQSPAFVEPFRFDAKLLYLNHIRFDVLQDAGWKEQPYRLIFTNGDSLYGRLESVGPEDLVFLSSLAGRVRVKRSVARCLERQGEKAAVLYSGPNSAAEWIRFPRPDSWRESEGGLASYLSNSSLRLDLELPPQVMVEFEVSWKVAADFELLIGIGKHGEATWPGCRLECVDGALVVRRETEHDLDLDKVMDLPAGEGRLQLRVLLDQLQQRVEVLSGDGLPLAAVKTENGPAEQLSGICLKHRTGRLRLEQLRVSRWSGAPLETVVDAPRIERTDGKVLYGGLLGYDAERREFRLAGEKAEQVCSADLTDRIFLAKLSNKVPDDVREPTNQVVCADNSRLSGWIDKLDGDRLYLECPGAVNADTLESVMLPIGAIRIVNFRRKVAAPTRAVGEMLVLELDDAQLHGALASTRGAAGQGGLGWKPLGSINSSALSKDASGRIDFPAKALPPKSLRNQLDCDKLYLRAGDVLQCQILSIDAAGVACQAAGAPLQKVSHAKLKAVELRLQPSQEPLPQDKRDRLLTLPRLLKDDPPTHVISSTNGDYLRGKLLELSDAKVRFEVNSREREFDRRLVSRVIWLHPEDVDGGDKAQAAAILPKGSVQVVRIDGTRMTFVPQEFQEGWISGTNELLGPCRVHVDQESELLIGARVLQRAQQSPFGDWKLVNATEPLVSRSDSAAGSESEESAAGSVLIGRPAPDFALETLAGAGFSLADARGKVVVLDFWASWCAPCMQGLPKVAELLKTLPAEQVAFAAVNLQQTPDEVQDALRRLKLSIPVALDRDGKVAEKYGATAIPYTIVIGRNGNVSHVFVGSGPRLQEELKGAIESHLSPPARGEPASKE